MPTIIQVERMIFAIRCEIPAKGLSFIEYTPLKERWYGQISRCLFINRRILPYLSEILIEIEGDIYRHSEN